MSLTRWDAITQMFEVYSDAPPSEGGDAVARGTLEIIPHIRAHPDLRDVPVTLEYMHLLFELPGKRPIYFWWESDGHYTISLRAKSEPVYEDKVTVPTEQVVPTLLAYIERVRAE